MAYSTKKKMFTAFVAGSFLQQLHFAKYTLILSVVAILKAYRLK